MKLGILSDKYIIYLEYKYYMNKMENKSNYNFVYDQKFISISCRFTSRYILLIIYMYYFYLLYYFEYSRFGLKDQKFIEFGKINPRSY